MCPSFGRDTLLNPVTTTLNIGYSYEPLYERDDVEKLMSLLLETKELTILSGSQVHTGK